MPDARLITVRCPHCATLVRVTQPSNDPDVTSGFAPAPPSAAERVLRHCPNCHGPFTVAYWRVTDA
jgi:hypothetical protein